MKKFVNKLKKINKNYFLKRLKNLHKKYLF